MFSIYGAACCNAWPAHCNVQSVFFQKKVAAFSMGIKTPACCKTGRGCRQQAGKLEIKFTGTVALEIIHAEFISTGQ